MYLMEQDELETLIKFGVPVTIIDVRKKPAVEKEPAMIEGAEWRDFAAADEWAEEVPSDRIAVCYCVHGHEVSQSAVAKLRQNRRRAYYLRGGFESWQLRSGPLSL